MDTVHFFTDEAGEYRWHRKSENGEIVAESGEGYEALQSAIDIVRDMFGDEVRYNYEVSDYTPMPPPAPPEG